MQSLPPQALPVESLLPQTLPIENIALQTLPIESTPLPTLPIESVPLPTLPIESVPLQTLPIESVPLQTLPIESVPLQTLPVESLPLLTVEPIRPDAGVPLQQDLGTVAEAAAPNLDDDRGQHSIDFLLESPEELQPQALPPGAAAVGFLDFPSSSPELPIEARRDPDGPSGQLGNVLRDLRRCMKNRQLYSHIENHGAEQLAQTFDRFQRLLLEHGELRLAVEVSTFLLENIPVFHDDSREMNFAFSLYRAGVRELKFQPDIERPEFAIFWSLIAADLAYEGPDDLLTRLWKEGFEKIHWIAHTDFDAGAGETSTVAGILADALAEASTRPSLDAILGESQAALAGLGQKLADRISERGLSSFTGETDAARAALEAELAMERDRVAVGIGHTLLEMAVVQSHPESGDYLAEAFEQVAAALLRDGRIVQLCAVAHQAACLNGDSMSELQRQALETALAGMGRLGRKPDHLVLLASLLLQQGSILPAEHFRSLAGALARESVEPLFSLLDEKLPTSLRGAIVESLGERGAADPIAIARRARTAGELAAHDLLRAISLLKVPRRVALYEPVLGHKDLSVRCQTYALLAASGETAAAVVLLGRQLEKVIDPDERNSIFDALGRCECRESEQLLATLLKREGTGELELMAIWRGLLQMGSPSALSLAMNTARENTRGLLGSARHEERKAALVEVVGTLTDPHSAKILATIAQEESVTSRALHKRAQDLLRVLRSRTQPLPGA